MSPIYEFSDYRAFLKAWIESQARNGRGMKLQLAKAAGVSSSLISLILSGQKHLSLEQASQICDHLGLNDRESDYFLLLVELGKAGTQSLKTRLKRRLHDQQQQAKKIANRVKKDVELTPEIRAIYYSSWIFTGIRNLTAVNGYQDIQSIAQKLNLPIALVSRIIEFLLEYGLCKRTPNGELTFGPAHTHLESDSPLVVRHHQNWRVRAFTYMDVTNESNLFYTCPMSLSAEAAEQIRRLLPSFIEQVLKIAGPSPSEKVYCWNMDWFEY